MGRSNNTPDSTPKHRPALDPEARENQLVALAVNLAEEQLRNGTASSQVITHYLKLGADKKKRKIEEEILAKQAELISAKTENLQQAKRMDEMYEKAIAAMQEYSGNRPSTDEEI